MPLEVLFLAHLPVENQSARKRVVQYFPYFRSVGIEPTFWPSVPSALHEIKNSSGALSSMRKGTLLLRALARRAVVDWPWFARFDALFVHREVFPFFTPVFERLAQRLNPRFIVDFDDAVYTEPTHYKDWRSRFRDPTRFADVLAGASHVVAGSDVLADYARQHNARVTVVPTALDPDRYPVKQVFSNDEVPVIGWIGAWATAPSLRMLVPVFERLARTERFRLKVIGDANIREIEFSGIDVEYCQWKLDSMVDDLRTFDMGVMPLPDTAWERGKCGGKLLQYMALGIPAVASPVGANTSIVSHGENGLLAASADEWVEHLRQLVRDPTLRQRLGVRARATLEERYSTTVTGPVLRRVIEEVAGRGR